MICQVLERTGVSAEACDNLVSLVGRLEQGAAVVLTEEALSTRGPVQDGGTGVGALLEWVARQPPWSDLPFIVLVTKEAVARSGGRAAVIEGLGNAVLLERPLNSDSLGSAARAAIRARGRQLAMQSLTDTLEHRVEERTRAVMETEARFRAVFEGFPEFLFVFAVTADGEFLNEGFNPAGERRAGRMSREVVGKPLGVLLDAAQVERVTAAFRRCVGERANVDFTEELRLPAGDGTFDITLTPMPDVDGRIARILGVARDVTERNQLEARLRQAQKLEAVGQLTGGVAHDFNNLLQVVLSGLTLMERVDDPGRRAMLADRVRRAAQRGGELTKRLLTVARRQSLHPEAIDLASWMTEGAGDLLARTLRGDIRTVLDVPAGLPPVEADPGELELAVLNIAVNARDAMMQGGTITVQAEALELDGTSEADGLRGRFIRLSLSDTGTGMDEATRARVFEPFFTTKEVGKGTGLGLAQVYGFAKQSGGGVRLRSAPGQGTTVSLLLPVSERTVVAAVAGGATEAGAGAAEAAVLVVEDDDEVAALVVDMLVQLGHRPTRVSTAAAALGALADGRAVDLLFTDVLMPGGMDGLALAREAARRRPGVRVLLTTGYTGGGAAATPLGVPVLRKPYRLDELSGALARALSD